MFFYVFDSQSTINQTNFFSIVPIQGWINCAVISRRNFFGGGLHCIKDFFATKGNVFQRFGLTLALSGSPCHCDSAHSDSLGLFLLFSAHSGSLSLAFWGAHRLIRSLLGSLRRSCVAPVYLVHCPIQLICNRIFIRFKFVFHDKAKRTQHRNLLQFFPPWCHQTQSSKQYSTIVITNHHPINDQGGWWLVPRSTIQTESLESKNFLQNHSRNCLSWSYNYNWYIKVYNISWDYQDPTIALTTIERFWWRDFGNDYHYHSKCSGKEQKSI